MTLLYGVVASGFNPLTKNFDQNVAGDILGEIFVDTNHSFTSPSGAAIGIPATDGHFSLANSTPGNGFEYGQLREGGQLVVPVGDSGCTQQLYLLEKINGLIQQRSVAPVRFVPMVDGSQ